jgi:hypothetical protein
MDAQTSENLDENQTFVNQIEDLMLEKESFPPEFYQDEHDKIEADKPLTALEMFETYKLDANKEKIYFYRLLSWEDDEREDFAADKELLGHIIFNADLELEAYIEKRFGGGHYLAQLKVNGKPKGLLCFHIAGQPKVKSETSTTQPQVVVTEKNPLDDIEKSLSFVERVWKLSPKQQATQPIERKSLKEELLDAQELVNLITPKTPDIPQTGKTVWDFAESVANGVINQIPAIAQIVQTQNPNYDFSEFTGITKRQNPVNDNSEETQEIEETNMLEILKTQGQKLIFDLFEQIGQSDDVKKALNVINKYFHDYPALKVFVMPYLELDAEKIIEELKANEQTAHFAEIPDLLVKLAKLKKELKKGR